MTFMTCPKRYHRFLAAFVACILILASNSLFAQNSPEYHGVAPWQAERAIKDYINRFINAQTEFAQKKLPNDQFSVRVKVEGLTRVYNKDTGWIWIAQFSGAILPSNYDGDKEQGYAHGILKIYADKNKDVQVVTNEGEGLWKMSQKTSILYQDLPETPGDWKEWGGDPADIPPSEDSGGNVESSGSGLGSSGQTSSGSANDAVRQTYDRLRALQQKCNDPNNPNRQKDCEDYYELYRQMNAPQ